MRIAYGFNRREKSFANANISQGKFFIDTKDSKQLEREAMLQCVKEGVTVVVMAKADLGRGAGQVSIIKAIEDAGGTVEVMEGAADAPEPLREANIQAEQEAEICRIWGNKALSEETRLIRIREYLGKPMDKHQVYYICVTKRKRQTGKGK
jgi:hypothetical protein